MKAKMGSVKLKYAFSLLFALAVIPCFGEVPEKSFNRKVYSKNITGSDMVILTADGDYQYCDYIAATPALAKICKEEQTPLMKAFACKEYTVSADNEEVCFRSRLEREQIEFCYNNTSSSMAELLCLASYNEAVVKTCFDKTPTESREIICLMTQESFSLPEWVVQMGIPVESGVDL